MKIETEDELITVAKNGYHILRKYGEAVDRFHHVHGSEAKQSMEYWRALASRYLKDPTQQINFNERPELTVTIDNHEE